MEKTKAIILAATCIGTFLLIVIPRILGINWIEITGIVVSVWCLGFTAFQVIKSNEEQSSSTLKEIESKLNAQLKELEDRLSFMISEYKKESAEKDKLHDDDLKAIRQETQLLPIIIQEHYRIKDEISRLSAALTESSKYAELLKRLARVEKLEKGEQPNT